MKLELPFILGVILRPPSFGHPRREVEFVAAPTACQGLLHSTCISQLIVDQSVDQLVNLKVERFRG